MKSHRLIFVLTLLLSWQSGIFAYHSDNFLPAIIELGSFLDF
jgi:hypothetical protein